MMLAFDIGNSAIKGAVFNGDKVVEARTLETTEFDSVLALERALESMTKNRKVSNAACVSVVPELTDRLASAVDTVLGLRLQVHSTASVVPIRVAYLTPETLGVDRLAAAVAAWRLFGTSESDSPRNVIVIDAGTTTTFELVTLDGVYQGGSIGPGPRLMRSALNEGTAQLPLVDLEIPDSPLGRSTDECMRSGILFGYLGSIEGLIARFREELTEPVIVVATGGWADWLSKRLPDIECVEPHLVLHGVRLISRA